MHKILLLIVVMLGSSQWSIAQSTTQPAAATQSKHDFDRWEKAISAYELADRENPPEPGGIVFIGSSTIRGWKTLTEDFAGHNVINRGFGGSQIIDAAHFADRIIIPYAPKAVFLRAGSNDTHAGKSSEQVFNDFKTFVNSIHISLPDTHIYYISLCPVPSRMADVEANDKLNALVKDYVKEDLRLHYVEAADISLDKEGSVREDLFVKDGVHFNADGYKRLIERVRPAVKEIDSRNE